MPKILLVYATNSGGTYVAGQMIKEILEKDFLIVMQNASETDHQNTENYDLIILGSPTWDFEGQDGMPHQKMLELLNKWQNKSFASKKFAIYGCGDKMFVKFCAAVDYMEKFVNSVGGVLVVSSLRLNNFFFELDADVAITKEWAEELRKKIK